MMPRFFFRSKSNDTESFVADLLKHKSQPDVVSSTSVEDGNIFSTSSLIVDEDNCSSSLAALKSDYDKLPDQVRSCFEYCCRFIRYGTEKGKLARLLLAEGLIQEIPGEIAEDIAANIITRLIGQGMLRDDDKSIKASTLYRQFSFIEADRENFIANAANKPLSLAITNYVEGKINPSWKNLFIISLSVLSYSSSPKSERGFSRASMETICGFQWLLVLDLNGEIAYLPDEVGELVHLRYLGLENSELAELPQSLGNLQKLQTLDIRMCGNMRKLPTEVMKIQQLRHLLMSRSWDDAEIIVPKGIGTLVNLHTLTGVYAGDGIAIELATLPQLRELGVKRVSEDHASELYEAIMKMDNLISLSLEAEEIFYEDERLTLLPEFELFSPPPLVQELDLQGGLVEMPIWISSILNLVSLTLSFSFLQEMPTSNLQFLPKLKYLCLWEAYKGKQIDNEFCRSGGFPELETLIIASDSLTEWTEIENGAFPKLKRLGFHSCFELRFLPEGLQNIVTLEDLDLTPIHEDLAFKLINDENYKIKNISKLAAYYRQKVSPSYVGNPKDVLFRI